MYNKKVLKKITSSLDKAKKPAAPKDIIVDPKGQWNHPGEVTRIPASNITMQGVNYPVMGVPNIGMPVMMYPGQDYDFPNADYVDEYPQMQDGGYTDAMNGMMKARLAYANEFGNPAAQRMINLPDNPYQFDNGNTGTHYMASMDNYAVPQIQDEDGQLMLGDYGPESDEAMRFESDEDADYFAKHYKDVSPGFMEMELSPEEIEEYAKGGYIIEDISVPELTKAAEGMVIDPLPLPTPAMKRDSLIIEQAFKKADPFKRAYLAAPKKDGKINVNLVNKYVNAIVSDKALIGARSRLSKINKEDPLKMVKVNGYNPDNPSLKVQGAFTFKPFTYIPPKPPEPGPDKKDKKENKKKEAVIVPSVVPAQQTVSNTPDPNRKVIGENSITKLDVNGKPVTTVEYIYEDQVPTKQVIVPAQPVVQPPTGRIIRKPGDPKYVGPATTTSVSYPKTPMPYNNALHKNGGELDQAQKGKVVKPLEISDPKEFAYRYESYNDSLDRYKGTINNIKKLKDQGYTFRPLSEVVHGQQYKEAVNNLNKGIKDDKIKPIGYKVAHKKNKMANVVFRDYKLPTQPVVFKKAPENQIVPTVEQMVTPVKVVQPPSGRIIRKPGDPKYVPYKENGGTLEQAQDGKTVKHTDKKGNTTITVTDDDGTQYVKVKTADGKVYNKTVPAMKPMSRDEFMQTDYYNQGIQNPQFNVIPADNTFVKNNNIDDLAKKSKSVKLKNILDRESQRGVLSAEEIERLKFQIDYDPQKAEDRLLVASKTPVFEQGIYNPNEIEAYKKYKEDAESSSKLKDFATNPIRSLQELSSRGTLLPDDYELNNRYGINTYRPDDQFKYAPVKTDSGTDMLEHVIYNPFRIAQDLDYNIEDKDIGSGLLNSLALLSPLGLSTGKLGAKAAVKYGDNLITLGNNYANSTQGLIPYLGHAAKTSGSILKTAGKVAGRPPVPKIIDNAIDASSTENKIIRQPGDPKYTEEGLKRFIGNTGVTAKTAAQSDELDLSDLFDDFDESEMARIFGERPLNQSNIPAYQRRTIIDFSNPDVMNNLTRENLLRNSSNEMAPDPDFLRRTTYNPTVVHETFDWGSLGVHEPFNWGALDDKVNRINRSGLSKDEILAKASKKDKDILSKMSDDEFKETVLKPTGDIAKYKPSLTVDELMYDTDLGRMRLKNEKPLSDVEYTQEFNKNLDELNKIIAKNNKSGVEYKVKKLDPGGNLIFETPEQTIKGWKDDPFSTTTRKQLEELLNDPVQLKNSGYTKKELIKMMNSLREDKVIPAGESRWGVYIRPGKWTGKVEDIANDEYFKNIPGINMSNTSSGVFSDRVTRRGTGTYESINEYLKKFDLGRVKPGFNSQTATSRGLWENAVQKGKAFGYYGNPKVVYGSMKSMLPYLVPTALGVGAAATQRDKFRKGGDINDEMELDLTPEEIKEYISKGYVIEQVH